MIRSDAGDSRNVHNKQTLYSKHFFDPTNNPERYQIFVHFLPTVSVTKDTVTCTRNNNQV